MQPPGAYDLITLEPPPIAYAGVSALYSREFYALARSRLSRAATSASGCPPTRCRRDALAMIRAFVDVFPQAVLLSGAESDLILLGTTAERIEIDPDRLAAALARAPAVRMDLERVDLGRAARNRRHVRRLRADAGRGDERRRAGDRRPAAAGVRRPIAAEFRPCRARLGRRSPRRRRVVPALFRGRQSRGVGEGARQRISRCSTWPTRGAWRGRCRRDAWRNASGRVVAGSGYLGMIVPESAELHNVLGIDARDRGPHGRGGRGVLAGAGARSRQRRDATGTLAWRSPPPNRRAEALEHLQRSAQLDPGNGAVQHDLGLMLAFAGRLDEAAQHLRARPRARSAAGGRAPEPRGGAGATGARAVDLDHVVERPCERPYHYAAISDYAG